MILIKNYIVKNVILIKMQNNFDSWIPNYMTITKEWLIKMIDNPNYYFGFIIGMIKKQKDEQSKYTYAYIMVKQLNDLEWIVEKTVDGSDEKIIQNMNKTEFINYLKIILEKNY